MKYRYFIFIFFSLFLYSQHYTSRWYGMDEGLPQNSIKDIIKDKYGFIWLSTDGGILRYDGTNFLLHNDLKVSNLSFADFLETKNRDIICFNDNEDNCVVISGRTVKTLPEEKISRHYVIVNNKQYKRYYKTSFINYFFPETKGYYISINSEKYVFDNHFIIYKKGNKPGKKILSDFPPKALKNVFEQNGVIYIADPQKKRTMILKDGIVSYDNQPSLYNHPGSIIYWHQGTNQVFVINNGNIYISKIFNGKPTLTFLIRYEKIKKELLYCMFYDEESNKLYFGNIVKGLNIITLSNFYVPQKNIPFTGEFVYEALPFGQSSIITKQGFEYHKNNVRKIFSTSFRYSRRYLIYDNSNNLLSSEFNKIHRRYQSAQYQKNDSISFPKRNVESIFKIGNHIMVVMADLKYEYYYLNIFEDDQFKKVKNIFRFNENINFIQEYDNDRLYVGTAKGIFLISLSKNKILKYLAKDLPIKVIQKTEDGNFWFTTYNKGFYLLKNEGITKMPEDKNGYLAGAHYMMEDDKGFFWISSNNGLFKISKNKLLEYAKNRKTKINYYRYTKEDGFLNNEFNGGANPSGNVLKNGAFVFPSMEGFVFFKPDEIKTHYAKKNQLFIERARVNNEIINFKDTLRIKSDYKTADIFLDFPYYRNIENLYMEAKLENSSRNGWEEVKKDRTLALNDIPPGNYILHVRFLVSENGEFAYRKAFIEIIPFFYQTLWFKMLIVVLMIAFIIAIIYMRTNYLIIINKKLKDNLDNKDQELELTTSKLKSESEYQQKIIKSITHDITTPVKFIARLSQEIRKSEDIEVQKKYFDGIYKTSEELYKFTLNLKEYTQLFNEGNVFEDEQYALYKVIEDKKSLFHGMASANSTTIINLCDPLLKIKTNKNILSMILHNLIDNAVKYTQNGEIRISADLKDDEVEIGIFDTGTGMSPSQIVYYSGIFESKEAESFVFKNYELGLHMVIQLIKKLNAEISFHENKPRGTGVKIILKKTVI